jgi:hypothetical protein
MVTTRIISTKIEILTFLRHKWWTKIWQRNRKGL